MKKRVLAGRKIHPIGLGAMALEEYGEKATEGQAIELFRFAVNSGIELIDTADAYGVGRSETLIGKALTEAQKEKIIIATKAGCIRMLGVLWGKDCSPTHIKEAIGESLQRLGLKKISLYQMHTIDFRVPLKESLLAFKELQDAGLVEHIGVSNFSLKQVKEAQEVIEVASVQNNFNLTHKNDEKELLPYLTEKKIPYLPYFPLGSGRMYVIKLLRDARLMKIADELKITSAQLALAWILNKWPTAIPIPGTKSKQHLLENMKAAEIELSPDIIKKLDALF
ncbi:MAG TPA: aldo/keto reductase [Nanoarchaeota archaeon]|nr:aldo/keto reductase [Nanoarchaeota archaeon]